MSTKINAARVLMGGADRELQLEAAEYVFEHADDGRDEKLEAAELLMNIARDSETRDSAAAYVFQHGDD
jgi:CRISPR/Cas system-associated endonuclease Cas3-HD